MANNQQAVNHTVNGVRVRSKIVPAVVDVRAWHRAHSHRPAPSRQPRRGALWQDTGLVFATTVGTALDAANVRRGFEPIVTAAGLNAADWSPREMRHTFVSVLSAHRVVTKDISRLVGHSSTRVTETVYRFELRPVLTEGAEAMDEIFGSGS